ncbi:hypothetical protein G6F56_002451 [Rhizopus delemar]|uniref:Uncharacterized protein n=1 Tax=Rhizopus stolonifer TaxID=4846 RepID=A0A367K2C2_RHIST|nr:hypothetical protein G6F56_002451 [Rhizopus delemar]RCH96307.1 hypothetical protein CU098_008967 [Rhizopus stolonifer]
MEIENSSGRDPKRPTSMLSPVPSSRQSMDLIEGTSQHFQQTHMPVNAHAQRRRWDAFFDPQYTFTAFIHQLDKRDDNYLKREHQKNVDHLVDTNSFGINSICSSQRQSGDVIMSNPSSHLASPKEIDPRLTWTEQDKQRLIHRLEILKEIRGSVLTGEQENKADTIVGRWKQCISMKAHRLCQEAGVVNDDVESKASTTSVFGGDEEKELHSEEEVEVKKGIKNCRRSFLLFLFGFIFPPLWLLGGIYFASYEKNQTSANRRLDSKWRRRSRVSFGVFIIALLIVCVTVFVINPSSVGFRHSE